MTHAALHSAPAHRKELFELRSTIGLYKSKTAALAASIERLRDIREPPSRFMTAAEEGAAASVSKK